LTPENEAKWKGSFFDTAHGSQFGIQEPALPSSDSRSTVE
jgi:hypothetical protein